MWFLTQYPEIEKACQNIDEIIAKAKESTYRSQGSLIKTTVSKKRSSNYEKTLLRSITKTELVMDRTFAKAVSFVGSNEYNLLQDARRDYLSYQVWIVSKDKFS